MNWQQLQQRTIISKQLSVEGSALRNKMIFIGGKKEKSHFLSTIRVPYTLHRGESTARALTINTISYLRSALNCLSRVLINYVEFELLP